MNYGTRALGPQTRKSKSYNWVGKLNYNITDAHRLEATAFGDPSRWPMQVTARWCAMIWIRRPARPSERGTGP